MRIHRDHVLTRALGIALGLGFLALGLFAVVGRHGIDGAVGDRALALGVVFMIAGIAAVFGSLTVRDPSRIW